MRLGFTLCACAMFAAMAFGDAVPITTGTLVDEMTDLGRLCDMPDPFFTTVQFSSYDHRSSVPGGPDWFANSDGFGGEPIPNFEAVLKTPAKAGDTGEYLVCDVQGPGALVRFWSARIEGTIRMYLDGNESPVFDGPAEEFFLHPYSRFLAESGLDEAVLANTFYQRNAAYCPVPFAKRCRVVWVGDPERIHFYQLQVRKYDPSASATTFTPGDLKTYAENIRRASRVMSAPDTEWTYASDGKTAALEAALNPGQKVTVLDAAGPAAIARLTLKIEAEDRDLALRQTILFIGCDDYSQAQVQSPVGDFFGAAPGVNPYISVPFSVLPDGTMTCRFVMPFEKKLQIQLENLGAQQVSVRGEALSTQYTWNPAQSMYFRARWRIDHGLTGSSIAPQDLPFLVAGGAGVYVGTVSYVLNPNEVPSSGGNWWGEGDEKVFVDGDIRPSTFGTGSEDYYNYAWSATDVFQFPYCGQPRNDGPANRGFVANQRWHIVDPLPFRSRLAFYMELFTHERTPGMAYGRIGYHYARPGTMDDHMNITGEDVRKQELPAGWMPAARGGASKSVFFQAEEQVRGAANAAMEPGNLWSKGGLYRWRPEKAGEEITFALPVIRPSEYVLQMAFAHDAGSGKVSMKVDGESAGLGGGEGIVNLFDPCRTMLCCIGGKRLKLDAGDHMITLRYEGPAEGQSSGTIGIDFIWLRLW